MAPRRPLALDNPPSASPSSEEEESEEVSDTEQPKNPSNSEEESDGETSEGEEREASEKPSAEKSDNENEDEDVSESGSETESDTAPTDFTVKPIVSKPTTESPKPKKPSAPKSAPKQASADVADAQKKKPNVEPKKSPIVRIWTEEGELAALRAMLEYKSKKGLDPYADTMAFFEFAKKSIPVEVKVNRNQVMDKIRRLKKKYEVNALKGDDPVFTKTHEQRAFEISKKIWGGAAESGGAKSAKRKAKRVEDSDEKESNKKAKKEKPLELVKDDPKEIVVEKGVVGEGLKADQVGFWDKYPRLKEAIEVENNGIFFKDGKKAMEFDLRKMGDAKAKELDDKWKRYQAKEAELKLLKLELVTEQTRVVLGELMKL